MSSVARLLRISVPLAAAVACRSASISPGPPPGSAPVALTVSSSAFVAGSPIPPEFTCDGADRSFAVAWTTMPQGVKSIAVVFDDLDAKHFTHWLLYDVDASASGLAEGSSAGVAATNDFDRVGYAGPCPPAGVLHHYRLVVYGLDAPPTLTPEAKRDAFDRALEGHVLAEGQLVGTFFH